MQVQVQVQVQVQRQRQSAELVFQSSGALGRVGCLGRGTSIRCSTHCSHANQIKMRGGWRSQTLDSDPSQFCSVFVGRVD